MALSHIALCDFGKLGTAYAEIEPCRSFASIVDDIRDGQIENVLQVLAIDPEEGTCRDVTADIGHALLQFEPDDLSRSARELIERCGFEIEEDERPFDPQREWGTLNGLQQGIRTREFL